MSRLKTQWTIIVCAPPGGAFEKEILQLKIPFYQLSPQYPFSLKPHRKSSIARSLASLSDHLPDLLQSLPHFDIVHSNTTYIIEGAALACARKVPHIWNLREVPGASPSWQPALGWEGMIRFIDDMSDSIVSVSQAIEKVLPEDMNAKRYVIHNGLDASTSMSHHESKQWLQSLGCHPNKKIALTIGNFIPEKGHSELLEVVTPLLKKYNDWQCLWIGEHHFTYPYIKKKIAKHGLQDRILCPGAIPRAGRKISGADLYLLPSKTEAFPTVLLEARLAGVPFLANNCGGAEEITEAGGGWCHPIKGTFYNQLERCFQGDLKAPALNKAAFSMDHMSKAYHNVYLATLNDWSRHPQKREIILSSMIHLGKDLRPLVEMENKIERAMSWRGIGRWFRKFFRTF